MGCGLRVGGRWMCVYMWVDVVCVCVCVHVGECMYVWVDVWEKGWGSYECVGVHVHGCVGGVKWGGGQVHSSYVYVWVGV